MNRVGRVMLITFNFPPIGTVGGSLRVVKFIKYLSRNGWNFNVLTPDRIMTSNWSVQANSAGFLSNDLPSNISIHQTHAWKIPTSLPGMRRLSNQKSKSHDRFIKEKINFLPIIHRIKRKIKVSAFFFPDADIPWLITAVPTGIRVVFQNNIDIIYAVAPPVSALVIGWFISSITRKPLIVDYKDDRIGTGIYKGFPIIIQGLHKYLERIIISKSQYVITVTPSSLRAFRKRHPKEISTKFIHIPNGADCEEYKCKEAKFKEEDRFVILNAGGYAPTYRNAKTFFEAIGQLLYNRPEFRNIIRVHFVGEGAHFFYGDIFKKYNLTDIFIESPTMNRKDFISTLYSADVLLLIQTLFYPTSIAGTFYEYWATGRAIILIIGEPGDMWNLLQKYELGFALYYNDVKGIRTVIEKLVDAHLSGHPLRISTKGLEKYDRKYLSNQLGDVLIKAMNSFYSHAT